MGGGEKFFFIPNDLAIAKSQQESKKTKYFSFIFTFLNEVQVKLTHSWYLLQ